MRTLSVRLWPFVSVNFNVNVPNRNVSFAPESRHSEFAYWGRALRLLMAKADVGNVWNDALQYADWKVVDAHVIQLEDN